MPRWWDLLVTLVVVPLALVTTHAAFAASRGAQPSSGARVITIQTSNSVPVLNIRTSGTLVLRLSGSAGNFAIAWDYYGIGSTGGRAHANGAGVGRWSGSALSVTLTSIASWSVPGVPQPATPATATIQRARGALALVSTSALPIGNLPIKVSPTLGNPLARSAPTYYTESTLGSGSRTISQLPGASSMNATSYASR